VNKKSSRIERIGILDMKKPDYYNLLNDLKRNISPWTKKTQKNLTKIEKY